MPTITQIIEVTTDNSGAYSHTKVFNPPGPFGIKINDLKARLLLPADTTITGTIDVDASDGNPQNQAQDFTISTGGQVSLGTWKLDGENNVLVASGQTSPVRANTLVRLEVQGTI